MSVEIAGPGLPRTATAPALRVAIIDPSLFTIPYDGALCDALVAAGCAVSLFGRALRPRESLVGATAPEAFFYRASEWLHGRLPGPPLRLVKGVEHALDLHRLRRHLAERPPDIVHFQWAPLPLVDRRLVPGFRRLAPTLLTVHDTTPFNSSPSARAQRLGARSVYAAFDHLVVHTLGGQVRLAAQGVPEAQISVIPHGPLLMPPPEATRPRAGERIVLMFGKIKPYKGLDLLIEALGQLPERLRHATRLQVVGEPFMAIEPLAARAAALGLGGAIDWDLRNVADGEIGGILAGADILVFPYREIEASGVLMAALPYGKPIVASAIGAFREVLRDGEHGRLVPPGDVAALAEALADLLADPPRAAAMGERVSALAVTLPGWDHIAARTMALYARLRRERRPPHPDPAFQLRP